MSEGCYLLRTNLTDTDPATLWKRYIQLTEAEWAFRITKDELEIRPIWHQKEDRVKAHILVCFLAYVLWKALAQWMRSAGLAMHREPWWKSLPRSRAAMWSSRPAGPMDGNTTSGCVVLQRRTQPRRYCSTGLAYVFRNGSAGSTRLLKCSHDFCPESALALSPGRILPRRCLTWVRMMVPPCDLARYAPC